MTIAAMDATGAPGGVPEHTYVPGTCNIGPHEIARRRRFGHIGLLLTLALFGVLVAVGAPPAVRLAVALPAIGSASGYLQAWLKFCAAFGSLGVFNFGPPGQTQRVGDDNARALDRMRSRQIALASLAIGLAIGVVAMLIPL